MDITSSMTGFNQGIVVPNSYGIELYIKGGTNYYRLTCVYKPKTSDYSTTRLYSSDDVDTQNLWEFTLTPKAGEPGATSNPSELSYAELFTYDSDTDFTGSEIYIKKGSPLHNYIVNTGHTYINTRKPWLYFGKLYPKNDVDSTILIETYSMKDYALDALPEHQRSNNIREFFGVAFDGMYSQVYYKIREILTLSDPWEVREDYLHYLLQTFGITSIMPSGSTEYDLDRFLIQNLPALLKRKGTYDALQGFFRFLTRSTNRLNIYEQWHELLPSGAPYPYDSIETYCTSAGYDWQEHLWTKYYDTEVPISAGAGLRYYNDPEIHSPYPFPASSLNTWISYPSGSETDPPTIPDSFLQDYLMDMIDGVIYGPSPGSYVFNNRSTTDTTIRITHTLGTKNLIIQLYTKDELLSMPPFVRFMPESITIVDERMIDIVLDHPQKFYAFISSDYSELDSTTFIPITGSSPYDIPNSIDYSSILEIFEGSTTKNPILPSEHGIRIPDDPHYIETEIDGTYYEVSLAKTYTSGPLYGETYYEIVHNLETPGVIVEVFQFLPDGSKVKIICENVIIKDINTVAVNLLEYTTEYEVVIRASSQKYYDLRLSPHYRVETDLSTQPIQLRKIIDAGTYAIMLEKFEQLRPVARYCESYGCVIKLPSDFTGTNIDTYNGLYTAFARTKCLRPVYAPLPGNYIASNRSTSTAIDIYHALGNKNLIVQLYTNDEVNSRFPYNRFIPKNIDIIDDNNITINLELDQPQNFFAFISTDYSELDHTTVIPISGSSPYEISGSIDDSPILEIYEEYIGTGDRNPIYTEEHIIDYPPSVTKHYMQTSMPKAYNRYYELSINKDFRSGLLTGSVTYEVIHGLSSPALLVEVYEFVDVDYIKKVMAADVIIKSANAITVNVESSSGRYFVVVKKITNSPFIRTIDDLMYGIDTLVLGDGSSTTTWNPLSTPSGSLQNEISPSAYEVESLIKYNNNETYSTYNIKATINILENINITEAGLIDHDYDNQMVFYTSCSPIEALEGTKLVLYFELERKTLNG